MHTIKITTDSHTALTPEQVKALGAAVLPMPFYIDGVCAYEGVDLTREMFFEKLAAGAEVTTSQASPAEVTALWDEELKTHDEILHFPISSGLSGSYGVARALSQDEPYKGRVFVVDTGRVATPQVSSLFDAAALIEKGLDAARIRDILEAERDNMLVYIAVDTLEYLKRGGRVSGAAAAVGTLLHVKPILKLGVGRLEAFSKMRGMARAKSLMIETLRHDLETTFADAYAEGRVRILAATSTTDEQTAAWVEEIRRELSVEDVLCAPLSLGVCCHTGGGAVAIGCARIPTGC